MLAFADLMEKEAQTFKQSFKRTQSDQKARSLTLINRPERALFYIKPFKNFLKCYYHI